MAGHLRTVDAWVRRYPVIAGMVSTTVFAGSALPMLVKAAKTRDLSSYSVGNLVLANTGNGIHSIYVFHLPLGPIWFLHSFYLLTSALMLFWWVRYRHSPLKGVRNAFRTSAEPVGTGAASRGNRRCNGARCAAAAVATGDLARVSAGAGMTLVVAGVVLAGRATLERGPPCSRGFMANDHRGRARVRRWTDASGQTSVR